MKLTNKMGYGAVAAAVSLACGSAYGATLAGPNVSFSAEGNETAVAGAEYTASVTVGLQANYLANDVATLSITNGDFGSVGSTPVTCGTSPNTAVMSPTSSTAAVSNYRVTSTSGSQIGINCVFGLPVTRASMTTTGEVITVAWSAALGGGGPLDDQSGGSATVGSVVSQFSAAQSVTALNGIIDVTVDRYQFTTDDAGAALTGSEDTLSFTTAQNSALEGAATLTSVVATISGDFSFIRDTTASTCANSDISAGFGQMAASFQGSGTLAISSDCNILTITDTAIGAVTVALGRNATGAPTGAALTTARPFVPGSFTASDLLYTYAGTVGGTASSTGSVSRAFSTGNAAGSWSLNGASVDIDYMPYGTGISRIIYVTNRSAQSGAVTVTGFLEDGTACAASNFASATANTSQITLLSSIIDAGITACNGGNAYTGKVALQVTVNVPGSGIEVYSAYNVGGNRVTVINNSNVGNNTNAGG